MSATDPIPQHLQELVDTVRNHAGDVGGEQREALAKIQVHSILATERATRVYEKAGNDLKNATLGLRNATWMLGAATLALGLVTFLTR